MFVKRALLPCFLAVALAATPVVADLASDRTAVFQQLLARPNDRSLMMQYARLSVEARDYEAAVSTLERVLDTDPASVEARYRLGFGNHEIIPFAGQDETISLLNQNYGRSGSTRRRPPLMVTSIILPVLDRLRSFEDGERSLGRLRHTPSSRKDRASSGAGKSDGSMLGDRPRYGACQLTIRMTAAQKLQSRPTTDSGSVEPRRPGGGDGGSPCCSTR